MISYHDQAANLRKHEEAARITGQRLVGQSDPGPKVVSDGHRTIATAEAHADALARRNRG